jgi:DNA polymerase (family 10)
LKPLAVAKLHDLGIGSLAEAEVAAREGRLRKVKGLGASVERKILEGAALARSAEGRLRANRAEELLGHAVEALKWQGVDDVTIAGDLRRGCELISDLRLVGTSASAGKIIQERLGAVTIDVVHPQKRGSSLLYATGSAGHIAGLEALAKTKTLVMNADGIGKPGGRLVGDSEETIYKRLGLPFIPPELREGKGEVEQPRPTNCQGWWKGRTSKASSTSTPTYRTACTRCGGWRKQRVTLATAIWSV